MQQVFPDCCIHFEDWKGTDAIRLLDRYADKILCYNDDIQGTASVALAGLTTALQIIDAPLTDQRVLFLGAGSAGIGIAKLIAAAMQAKGLSQDEARSRISMFDIDGLLEPSRANLSEAQKVYAHKASPSKDLAKTIETLKPTVLIGVSTKGGAFTQRVVEAMSRLNERPIIFALSNPTDKAECTAEQAYTWSKGKALFAAGVQFPDVTLNGRTYHPGQANNFYIFPAVGLATYAARPRRITDECFIVAAQASADQIGPDLRAKGMLFPGQDNILETEITTATRVAEFMFDEGLAQNTDACARAAGAGRPASRGGRAHSLDSANTREAEDRSLRSDPVRDEVIPEVKNPKLSSWDVAYALNMAIACLITYWIMTHTLSRFVDESSDFLGGMWAVVATVFVFRETRLGSLSAGIARLIATCVSFALCLLYLSLFPFTPVGMAALIAIG